ncbi:hypothetical protein [Salmonella phage SE131]|uniref:Uncharacterized protein n=1 Tax=Salmonella phage SE131 TaxID=2081631 RepID=A0A2P1CA86_9CAUD|nr:hypothetical protein PQC35_gp012 [Salmonella phage SE131]AVJ48143.1 hypothetical protein [Salmonella phage SE131]
MKPAVIGQTERDLDRRERLLNKKNEKSETQQISENLRRLREEEYSVRRNNTIRGW